MFEHHFCRRLRFFWFERYTNDTHLIFDWWPLFTIRSNQKFIWPNMFVYLSLDCMVVSQILLRQCKTLFIRESNGVGQCRLRRLFVVSICCSDFAIFGKYSMARADNVGSCVFFRFRQCITIHIRIDWRMISVVGTSNYSLSYERWFACIRRK